MGKKKEMNKNCLWYDHPACDTYEGWERQALPIGNGELGCKIFGGVCREHIQFNEKSLWTGTVLGSKEGQGLENTNGNGALNHGKSVKAIQDLLRRGKVLEATEAMQQLQGDEIGLGAYQNFGELYLSFPGWENAEVKDYVRSLDIGKAESQVTFSIGNQEYSREYWVSYPDRVGVVCLRGDMESVRIHVAGAQPSCEIDSRDTEIRLGGYAGGDSKNGLRYEAYFQIQTDGVAKKCQGDVEIHQAKEIRIIFSAATNYQMKYPEYRKEEWIYLEVEEKVKKAFQFDYDTLKKRHREDYQSFFERVFLEIEQEENSIPTNQLLAAYQKGTRSRLLEYLMFQYGRYLIISSSREGGLPANLQGVWNALNAPPWQSDYHLNINLQMNYWLTMNTNLTELAKPLVDYVNGCLVIPGRQTAWSCVGIGDGNTDQPTGWMAHTQNNIFGHTGPGSNWRWGWAPTTGAFILENTYEHYRFTKDITYLDTKIYPAMEEAALLWNQLLIEEEETNRLVVSPCFSPEHGPVSIGNTFDQEMVWQLFYNVIEAAKSLKEAGKGKSVNQSLIDSIEQKMNRLEPISIGKWGQIKEWHEEDTWENRGFDQNGVVENHRHFSHMMGLYPGNHITQENPEWMKASKISMEDRKDYGEDATPGWSKSLKMGAWARLQDGEKCDFYIRKVIEENTYDNLWETHPPFQIDGNLGTSAGMAEMLLQSHTGIIHLLPALPEGWKEAGEFRGLLARGNVTVSCKWKNGTVTAAQLTTPISQNIKVKINGELREIALTKGKIEVITVDNC